jgi:hypothetical protein
MATFLILPDHDDERDVCAALMRDWLLYGAIHMTNARGLTRLDPVGITYAPTGNEVQARTADDQAGPSLLELVGRTTGREPSAS